MADSMLFWLGNISQHGVNPNLYPVDSIREELQQIRTLKLREGKTMNRLLADVEYQFNSRLSFVCVSIEIRILASGAQME